MAIEVDTARTVAELEQLASFSDATPPAVTRVVFTEADREARAWFKNLCLEAKLEVREDAVGNTFARWLGVDADAPAIGTGSHIDAIPEAGQYDGTVGVLGGLEAIRALKRSGFQPRRSIELLLFTSEEPTRFGIGCLGSRLLSGSLSAQAVSHLHDGDDMSLDVVRRQAGFDGELASVCLAEGHYAAFLELHIEQMAHLESAKCALGIVTDIAAPACLRMVIEGDGGHAGAVLMPERRDALLGAAEIALAVEKAALVTKARDTVATTGVCRVSPGAVNSVPSRVVLEIDIRDVDGARRDRVVDAITEAARNICTGRRLVVQTTIINADAPATCDSDLVALLEQSAGDLGLSSMRMVSRAYHDSLFMSRVAPTAMLFIPCLGGISHRPDEYASPNDIANGVRVLACALKALAS